MDDKVLTTGSGDGSPPEELRGRVARLEAELAGLRRAMRTRARIEQAMGVLTVLHQCSPDTAFRLLVRLSQQHNTKLHHVAQLIVQLAGEHSTAGHTDRLLERLSSAEPPRAAARAGAAEPQPRLTADPALIAAAHQLVDAYGPASTPGASSPTVRQALVALYQLLVDRGWIPPYEVLHDMGEPAADEQREASG
ncbi:ANTAR domain-containing protein [Goodfellowiella coeruleoviolacea]|uniref:ANTAR domain-containing protein n=1 Tax=Goodfellowiella coeruleoviolacea TaxID=334858 RepID=A0AAE3GAZ4_9PSEU|nr:ANTAR domain-containing protein [Goodfellowiella coeruleoviolacea]MCP2163724.1 ANTAR domain-containing protein [Goodfellowiella coeruleoviolacea]